MNSYIISSHSTMTMTMAFIQTRLEFDRDNLEVGLGFIDIGLLLWIEENSGLHYKLDHSISISLRLFPCSPFCCPPAEQVEGCP